MSVARRGGTWEIVENHSDGKRQVSKQSSWHLSISLAHGHCPLPLRGAGTPWLSHWKRLWAVLHQDSGLMCCQRNCC